jgi:hypothetical protein
MEMISEIVQEMNEIEIVEDTVLETVGGSNSNDAEAGCLSCS